MAAELTIGIPTCGRPEKVRACLESISNCVTEPVKIIVVDSMITDQNRQLYSETPNCEVVAFDEVIGPSAARREISKRLETDYLLFMDDDNEVVGNGVSVLLQHLKDYPAVGIVAGCWCEIGGLREAGQNFHEGIASGIPVVTKSFVEHQDLLDQGLTALEVDACLATMLIRASVFEQVSFDPEYDFFLELFDFFIQCKRSGIRIEVRSDVVFNHSPSQYGATTMRQTQEVEAAEAYFENKWGVRPYGARSRHLPSSSTLSRLKGLFLRK